MRIIFTASICLAFGAPAFAADRQPLRFEGQRCSGFDWGKLGTVELSKPISVRKVSGTIGSDNGRGDQDRMLDGAVVQVCGAGTGYKIRQLTTDRDGQFVTSVPRGDYTFVAVKDGYQSVTGALHVSWWSCHTKFRVRLPAGGQRVEGKDRIVAVETP
jgi:hypothetical protein